MPEIQTLGVIRIRSGVQVASPVVVQDGQKVAGTPGKSAYQLWLDEGNTGTMQDFFASIGPDIHVSDTPPPHSPNRIWIAPA